MDKRLILWMLLLVGIIGTSAFGNLSSGLVAHWEFEGDFKDSAGTNHGTPNGDAKVVTDPQHGQVLELDGTGDYVEVPNSPSLNLTGDKVSLAAWVSFDNVVPVQIIIAKVFNNTTHSSPYFSYGLHMLANGQPRVWISRTGGAAYQPGATGMFKVGTWHHVAGIYNGAELRLYIDGKLAATNASVSGTIIGYDTVLRLGTNGGLTEPMDGKMDDVRIYGRALSEREVLSLATGISLNAAWNPSPADGAVDWSSTLLMWSAGDNAVFQHVYVGTTEELTEANKVAGPLPFTQTWHPMQALAADTTYYWRVDEVEANQTLHKGSVWSFTTPPLEAYAASPADGVRFINPAQPTLTWKSGMGAFTHDVYFGDNADDVANGTGDTFKVNQPINSFAPGALAYGKTYYWRIDEIALDLSKATGHVWSFLTIPAISLSDATLVGWWRLDEGEGTTVVDWSGQGHHGTLNGSAQWVEGLFGGALDFEFSNTQECVVVPAFDVTSRGITLAAWVRPESFAQHDARIIDKGRDVAVANDAWWMLSTNSSGTNYVLRFRLKTNESDTTTTQLASSGGLTVGNWAHVAAVWDGTNMILYQDGVEVGRVAKGGTAVAANPDARVYIGNQLASSARRPWDGLIDDVRVYAKALSEEQIAQIMARSNPLAAYEPQPASGAAMDIRDAKALEWSPGDTAAKHDVYFGTSKQAVSAADVGSPEYVVRQTAASFSLQGLVQFGGAYFWRVDEVEADGTTIHAGDVWGFTVYDYLFVDNFESYTNESPFRIFQTWLDRYGYSADDFFPTAYAGNGNGAGIGHDIWTDTSPYYNGSIAERGLVNSGRQSMPLYFDNSSAQTKYYSETERTWTSSQDWTVGGVDTLVLHVHGNPRRFVKTSETSLILSGAGADIYGNADQCRYAYKQLTGDGTIIARVVRNGSGTNLWSKGGVMIRAAADAGATNATTVVTGGNGAGGSFQYRSAASAATTAVNNPSPAVAPPCWVKIERVGNSLSGYFSPDGVTWKQHSTTQTINMIDPVLIGICVTSHAANQLRAYEFDNISTTGNVTGQWQVADIGVAQGGNEQPEPLYVTVQDWSNRSFTIVHPDANIAMSETWTPWAIPLSDFTGVNTAAVRKMFIGLGSRNSPKAGGAGLIYIDDIRVIRPQ